MLLRGVCTPISEQACLTCRQSHLRSCCAYSSSGRCGSRFQLLPQRYKHVSEFPTSLLWMSIRVRLGRSTCGRPMYSQLDLDEVNEELKDDPIYRAHSDKTRPSRLLVGTPSKMGLSSGSQTLECLSGKCLSRKMGVCLRYALIAEGIWKGDILVADIEGLEKTDASEIHPRRIINPKEVLTPQRREDFTFPIADGTAKLSGRDQEFREPTPRREQPWECVA